MVGQGKPGTGQRQVGKVQRHARCSSGSQGLARRSSWTGHLLAKDWPGIGQGQARCRLGPGVGQGQARYRSGTGRYGSLKYRSWTGQVQIRDRLGIDQGQARYRSGTG